MDRAEVAIGVILIIVGVFGAVGCCFSLILVIPGIVLVIDGAKENHRLIFYQQPPPYYQQPPVYPQYPPPTYPAYPPPQYPGAPPQNAPGYYPAYPEPARGQKRDENPPPPDEPEV